MTPRTASLPNVDAPPPTGRRTRPGEASDLATRYLAAVNGKDVEALVGLLDPEAVFTPALRPQRCSPVTGHGGVRRWWSWMDAGGMWYQVESEELRRVGARRWALIGELRHDSGLRSPWATLIEIRHGVITESHEYLSDPRMLEHVGVL